MVVQSVASHTSKSDTSSCSSLNVFDDGVALLRSILWTLSIVSMFCNHNASRDGSSLVIR
jgi:hypothetical protein